MDKNDVTFKVNVVAIKVRVDLLGDKDYFKWLVRGLKCLRDAEKWGYDIKMSYDDSSKVAGSKTNVSATIVTIKVNADLLGDKDYFKWLVRRLKCLSDLAKWRSDFKVSYDDSSSQ